MLRRMGAPPLAHQAISVSDANKKKVLIRCKGWVITRATASLSATSRVRTMSAPTSDSVIMKKKVIAAARRSR